MGRKRKIKTVGLVDMNAHIIDVPEKIVDLLDVICSKKNITQNGQRLKFPIGKLLRDYIVAGAEAEAKKLKIAG